MKNKLTITKQDKLFFTEIAEILQKARKTAYKAVNTVMVNTNWLVGKRIVEQEQKGKVRADYEDHIIVNLSRYLTGIFGSGFSEANLWNFRQFYLTFPDGLEFSTRCVENLEKVAWSHWRLIMRIEDEAERNYYITETSQQNWNVKILERNIRSGYYRRLLSTQKKAIVSVSKSKNNSFDFIKDLYVLEFLDVPEDLIGKETVLEKDETVVKYSVLKENKQIFASKYKTILPTEKQLAAMIEKRNTKLLEEKHERRMNWH